MQLASPKKAEQVTTPKRTGCCSSCQIYRKWATMRLKHLAPWIHRWALPQMYAGFLVQGAEQAWWQLSLGLEYWRSQQTQATGSATDIYKCFDQSVRPLVYTIARIVGIPKRVLTEYVNIMEAIRVRNSLTVGYGAPHTRRRGKPQGCPFTMTFTALIVRPWMIQVLKRGAIPRVLADRPSPCGGWRETLRELPGSHQRCPHLPHHCWRTNRR